MPKPYPREFREDVVAVARGREPGVPLRQIAADFGISETCLQNWLRQADVEVGTRAGTTAAEAAETRELKKRVRLLELGNNRAGIVDGLATIATGKHLVLYVWYDNEYGYSSQVLRVLEHMAEQMGATRVELGERAVTATPAG